MPKIIISEARLKKMVSESVRKVLNEIGDTQQGRAMLANATAKATNMGRPMQANKFASGLASAIQQKYGEGASRERYAYKAWDGSRVFVYNNGTIIVNKNGGDRREMSMEEAFQNMYRLAKTSDKRVARQIAGWCGEFLNKTDERTKAMATDWHTWASQ
jgi:hypothetical protein